MSEEHEQEQEQQLPGNRDFADYFYFFVERFWIILFCLIATVAYGLYKVSTTADTYRSSAVIEARGAASAVGELNSNERRMYIHPDAAAATLKSKLSQEGLFYEVAGRPVFADLLPNPSSGADYEAAKRNLGFQFQSNTMVLGQGRTRSSLGTGILTISSTHTDPIIAKEIVAGLLEMLRESNTSSRTGASSANIILLNKEIAEIRTRLSDAEQSLAIYNQALSICTNLRETEARIIEMQKVYLENWPPLVQEKTHLELLSTAFSKELSRITKSVEYERQFWSSRGQESANLTVEELLSFQISTTEARHNMISRDFSSDSRLYEILLSKVKMGDVEMEFDQKEFAIIQHPSSNLRSIRMTKMAAAIRYGLQGLCLGLLLATIHGFLDTTIRRVEDLEKISGIPVLAAVPSSTVLKNRSKNEAHSPQAEAFRTLHASVSLSNPDAKTILVTSSIPGEGKSTISANLAATDAKSNPTEKVILVDLDLRRPKLASYLDLPTDHPGVFECLSGKSSIQDAIQRSEEDTFDIMTAGNIKNHNVLPDEKLIEQLFEILKKRYDRIIIDSAPVLAVSDSLIIAKQVDAICFVFRMWKTPKKAIKRALAQLDKNQTYPMGVVSNFMPAKRILGQGNYYYSYSNAGYSSYS
tara:strand:+ start:615 stop:2540 length:1926 start_codon:yes stop_codon:yes gene_type:complete